MENKYKSQYELAIDHVIAAAEKVCEDAGWINDGYVIGSSTVIKEPLIENLHGALEFYRTEKARREAETRKPKASYSRGFGADYAPGFGEER